MQPLLPWAEARGCVDVAGITYVYDPAAPCGGELFGAGGGYIKIVCADHGYGFEWEFDDRDRCEACCARWVRLSFGITWGN